MTNGGFTISVAIPTMGRPRYLRDCLESVAAQTRQADDVVVSEDGESRETALVVAEFADRLPIRHVINAAPLGEQGNRRRAFAESTGTFVAMVDDDDAWEPRFLEVTSDALAAHPECAFCSTDHWWMDADGETLAELSERSSERFGRSTMRSGVYDDVFLRHLQQLPFAFQSTLFRRDALERIGFVPEGREGAATDFSIYLELGATRVKAFFVAEKLGRYRTHPGQATHRRVVMSDSVLATLERVAQHPLTAEERAAVGRHYRRTAIEKAVAYAHAGERRRAIATLREVWSMGIGPVPLRRLLVLAALVSGVRRAPREGLPQSPLPPRDEPGL